MDNKNITKEILLKTRENYIQEYNFWTKDYLNCKDKYKKAAESSALKAAELKGKIQLIEAMLRVNFNDKNYSYKFND